jgi:acetylglutamate kinase
VVSHRFAIVRVSGDVLTSPGETAAVAAALAFLHRLGLVPVVVHGAGLFTGRRSGDVAAASNVTAAARAHMLAANAALVAALRKEGVEAAPFTSGVFSATRQAAGRGAHGGGAELAPIAGDINGVAAELLSAAAVARRVPVVAALAAGGEGAPFLSFPTLDACGALARALRPLKVIWLRPEGGLRAADGDATVRTVDFNAAAGGAQPPPPLLPRDAALLPGLRALYEAVAAPGADVASAGATISVTKPEHLAAELLSPGGGSGTVLLRRERVRAVDAAAAHTLDLPRVAALIQEAFGAPLPERYLADLVAGAAPGRALRRVYVTESYRGVAIVTEEAGMPGVAYLDKFAVARSAQGDRLGETLWRAMLDAEADTLYWRSRSSNTVNPWYFEQAHGALKAGDWTVFWRGLAPEKAMPAVACALALKPTFPLRVYPQPATAAEAAEQPQLK